MDLVLYTLGVFAIGFTAGGAHVWRKATQLSRKSGDEFYNMGIRHGREMQQMDDAKAAVLRRYGRDKDWVQ